MRSGDGAPGEPGAVPAMLHSDSLARAWRHVPLLARVDPRPTAYMGLRAGATTPTRKARPKNTIGALLFRTVADTPVLYPDEARFVALVTRNEYQS